MVLRMVLLVYMPSTLSPVCEGDALQLQVEVGKAERQLPRRRLCLSEAASTSP